MVMSSDIGGDNLHRGAAEWKSGTTAEKNEARPTLPAARPKTSQRASLRGTV